MSDPWPGVFAQSCIENLVAGLYSPVSSDDEKPLLWSQPIARETRDEVAILILADRCTAFSVTTKGLHPHYGTQMRFPAFGSTHGRADVESSHGLHVASEVFGARIAACLGAGATPLLGLFVERWLRRLEPKEGKPPDSLSLCRWE